MDGAEFAARARRHRIVVVGLHVRRGDYARWADGRFYWSAEEYARIAERARELYPGRRVAVLACSDDPEVVATLGDVVAPGPGHEVQDLYPLAACDAILGPPSTYSAWASLHGGVPLRHLGTPDAPLALDDFERPA